jgi:hypothetical protein
VNTAAKVAERKQRQPDLYCSEPRCLWLTGGGKCPRHGGPAWTPERQREASAKARGEAPERKCHDCGESGRIPGLSYCPVCHDLRRKERRANQKLGDSKWSQS